MLNLRDGGWEPQAGLVAAWFAALWVGRAHPGLRKPLAAGVGLASVIWLATLVALALPSNDDVRLQAMAQPTLPTLDGKAAALADFKGRPTVVNLWATWCPPCRNEMPVLQQAQAAHADLHFVFLNQGETADKVRGFVAAHLAAIAERAARRQGPGEPPAQPRRAAQDFVLRCRGPSGPHASGRTLARGAGGSDRAAPPCKMTASPRASPQSVPNVRKCTVLSPGRWYNANSSHLPSGLRHDHSCLQPAPGCAASGTATRGRTGAAGTTTGSAPGQAPQRRRFTGSRLARRPGRRRRFPFHASRPGCRFRFGIDPSRATAR